ncbi:hypothetical protein HanRHA438_Chr03g0122821 [Helianthus annuus]|nr:hypothetical protein HanRHA438_Chr03g0122821 [Helianthus annuus]
MVALQIWISISQLCNRSRWWWWWWWLSDCRRWWWWLSKVVSGDDGVLLFVLGFMVLLKFAFKLTWLNFFVMLLDFR